jgi:hypothetical protein
MPPAKWNRFFTRLLKENEFGIGNVSGREGCIWWQWSEGRYSLQCAWELLIQVL